MPSSTKTLIILGSSRSNGDTRKVVDYLRQKVATDFIDLNEKQIGYFDYNHANQHDDFLPLMETVVNNYDRIIFATPVYWYSMSAIMKTFFDRISDLLKIRKEVGRQLRGMKMGMVSCSGADDRIPHFEMPFVESAKYLGMEYLGDIHTWVENGEISPDSEDRIRQFANQII